MPGGRITADAEVRFDCTMVLFDTMVQSTVFMPGKKVGGPRIADDPQQAAGRLTPQKETRSRTIP